MRKSRSLVFSLALCGAAAAMLSYLLPGDYILEKVSEHTRTVQGIYVKQKLVFYLPKTGVSSPASTGSPAGEDMPRGEVDLPDYEPPPDGMSAEELMDPGLQESNFCQFVRESELIIRSPGLMRLRVYGPAVLKPAGCPCSLPRVESYEILKAEGKAVIINRDSVEPVVEDRKWFFTSLLTAAKAAALKSEMMEIGVDLEMVRLVLIDDKVAYQVGGEEGGAGVWLDKDSFLPLRIRHPAAEGELLSTDLLDYKYLAQQGVWYPARIDFLEGGKLKESWQMVEAVINPRLNADTFDTEKIQASLRGGPQ